MDRQPNTWLPDDIQPYEPFPVSNFERLFDGLDRQLNGVLRYASGTGVISGMLVQAAKTVSAGTVIVGGGGQGTWVGQTSADTDISALLTDSKENIVWVASVNVPSSGADSWPGYEDTFTAGKVVFKVQDLAPPNSIKLGTITLDGASAVTATDNIVLDRPAILPMSWKTWTGVAEITDVEAGTTTWVEVDHSGDIEFSVFGEITYWNPKSGGFVVRKIENAQSGQLGFELLHHAGASYPYFAADSIRIYWTRMGIPK